MLNGPGGRTMCVKIETLHEIFKHKQDDQPLEYQGTCRTCGKSTSVTITKTTSGYGFLGGVIREAEAPDITLECDACFKRSLQKSPGV
jgi:hypothetical protein